MNPGGVPGAGSGWHAYGYDASLYSCLGASDDCGAVGSPCWRPTNYYACKHCRRVAFFKSKIATFRADDIQRCEAAKRMGHRAPLGVCKEMVKVHKDFCAHGGTIRALTRPGQLPTILWDGMYIRGIVNAGANK